MNQNVRYARGLCKKMKRVIKKARSFNEKATAFITVAGILNRMRITGFIEKEEYNRLYDEMTEFSKSV